MNFPVFAKGKNPAGPFKEGPGEINVQISCAGVSVNPGDLIVGDDDGVVVVPKDKVVEVLERAKVFWNTRRIPLHKLRTGRWIAAGLIKN